MKQFLLFGGDQFYPSGGWNDYAQDYETLEEAKTAGLASLRGDHVEWVHIVDTSIGVALCAGSDGFGDAYDDVFEWRES